MIEFHVNYYFESNEKRDAFYSFIKENAIDASSRAEKGNIRYDYYLPIEKDCNIYLVEQWKDQKAVAEHAAAEHYALLQKAKPDFVKNTEIVKFEDVK